MFGTLVLTNTTRISWSRTLAGMHSGWDRSMQRLVGARASAAGSTAPAVPMSFRDLSALLARNASHRPGLTELWQVEHELRAKHGLDRVPHAVLQSACAQLEELARGIRSPGLALLQLQMRRRLTSEAVRERVAEQGETMRWRPALRASSTQPAERTGSTIGLDSEFASTVPLDATEVFAEASNRSKPFLDTLAQ